MARPSSKKASTQIHSCRRHSIIFMFEEGSRFTSAWISSRIDCNSQSGHVPNHSSWLAFSDWGWNAPNIPHTWERKPPLSEIKSWITVKDNFRGKAMQFSVDFCRKLYPIFTAWWSVHVLCTLWLEWSRFLRLSSPNSGRCLLDLLEVEAHLPSPAPKPSDHQTGRRQSQESAPIHSIHGTWNLSIRILLVWYWQACRKTPSTCLHCRVE